jgi:hypothetical protein
MKFRIERSPTFSEDNRYYILNQNNIPIGFSESMDNTKTLLRLLERGAMFDKMLLALKNANEWMEHGDFKNGVTTPMGDKDEGETLALKFQWELYDFIKFLEQL